MTVACPECGYEIDPTQGLACPRCGTELDCSTVSCGECDACPSVLRGIGSWLG